MSTLYAYNYPSTVMELDGSLIMDSANCAYWSASNEICGYNANIINSILNNMDNYFDFNKNFIDIGARYGEFSRGLATKFNHVFAFEPNKKSAALIYTNCLLNDTINKVDVYNIYLSDKNSTVYFNGWCDENDININVSKLVNDVVTKYDGEHLDDSVSKITSHTLDEYNFDNIGFIKIDTEGYELNILKGAAGTILRNNCPPILFELLDNSYFKNEQTGEEYKKSIISFLNSLGYSNIIQYGSDPQNYLALK
ncbi:FkbM family methyltransferase [uncultured Methanobrevibacter sp.]|uniref:FkbM family methyltransferase n=1 Tax=uncultured Methanobrevibacter sp. TaxID=253161 RepID=UPI0025F387B8|nr:FkbM family methyltransferase [uncultured Methanobrevibacter sp.]